MAEAPVRYLGFARKWRPQSFDELVGQPHISQTLKAEVEKGRISHAYLFAGPRGVGKTSTARILAKAVNCEKGPTPTPCAQCAHCQGIAAGSDLDVIEIDGASNNGVDQVRDLREHVHHVPFASRYKVYIIDEVHMLSIAAFNALLKTLEEPPRFVVFVFATTEPERIPQTIKSRCQVFNFRSITVEDIVSRLDHILTREGVEAEPSERAAVLETIAISAEGGMRDAQVALDQVISLSEGTLRLADVRDFLGVADTASLFSIVENIRDRKTAELLQTVRDLTERGRDLERFAKQILAFLRDLMVLQCAPGADLVRLSGASLDRARRLAAALDPALLINAISVLLDLEARMKQGTQTRILLEFALARLTAFDALRPIAELIQQLESAGPGVSAAEASAAAKARPRPFASPPPAPNPARYETAESFEGPALFAGPEPIPPPLSPGPPPQARAIPLQQGGALEPVGCDDIAALQAMLAQTIRSHDPSLGRTLEAVPLERIEGRTAYFGKPGQPINPYDAKRLDKPETKRAVCDTLAQLTGLQDLSIRIQGRPSLEVAQPPPPPPQSAPPPPVAPPRQPRIEEIERPEAEEAPAADEDPALYDGDAEAYEITPEEARRALGRRGLSAQRIRQLLRENEALRSKIELARKFFDGAILDGEGNPVET